MYKMLEVKQVYFNYQDKNTLEAIDFSLKRGENLAIIGESGCGKSTLLKLIYGLYDLNQGEIFWNNEQVLGPKFNLIPGMPFMKYLAQDFDLMPYITVAENVGHFLSNFYPEEKQERIKELLTIVEMTEFAGIKAKYLSGGQMQRVALARVLAREPELLLLDEPFSHIDNFRKNSLRRKLFLYLKAKQITTLIATHDSTDVLSFSDEVLVLKEGKIVEKGTPNKVYHKPNSIYAASLFGDVNEIQAHYFHPEIKDKNKIMYCYPHQLEVVKKSSFEVFVICSYFRGSHYLIESLHQNNVIFFQSAVSYNPNTVLFLKMKNNLLAE